MQTEQQIKLQQLKQYQALSLNAKIRLTEMRIREWYDHHEGLVYVAFSGGKDSTVLLDIVRSIYPKVPAVFVDTGLEYPEIREFVKSIDNVTWIKPKMRFDEVIKKHGYPVISKEQSMAISRWRNTADPVVAEYRKDGTRNGVPSGKSGVVSAKWHHLLAYYPIKISDRCCDIMKKQPFHRYEREAKLKPFIGTMATESSTRKQQYYKEGCQSFNTKNPQSRPMSFWSDEDVWEYIKTRELPYSSIYDMGEARTGCMFCMFGVHLDKGENRFQRMAKTHPKQYDYCINKLGCGAVMDLIGVNYEPMPDEEQLDMFNEKESGENNDR